MKTQDGMLSEPQTSKSTAPKSKVSSPSHRARARACVCVCVNASSLIAQKRFTQDRSGKDKIRNSSRMGGLRE